MLPYLIIGSRPVDSMDDIDVDICKSFCESEKLQKKHCFNNHVHNNQGMGMDSGRYPYDITLLLNNNLD